MAAQLMNTATPAKKKMNVGRFDLSSIRLAVLCSRHKSLSAASREANMSISGASHRLRRLEEALARTLFLRHRRGLTLTPEGRSTILQCERMLTALEDMVNLQSGYTGRDSD